jgi:hypothetical protein
MASKLSSLVANVVVDDIAPALRGGATVLSVVVVRLVSRAPG